MPPAIFEPTISADERPQTYALDRAATGTAEDTLLIEIKKEMFILLALIMHVYHGAQSIERETPQYVNPHFLGCHVQRLILPPPTPYCFQ